ncbi:cationic amino acid transporter 9, chloroplastic-like [Malania oleifera]|uniref:cationic amino acid transporter 9, chloroplastic-like n=1 Tax=Malania oleifera TaxID=397392 RepID=UPI0025ADE2C4|nr:cationic amino acid transporter 9, chloroplastic-like [Malania oleifera]
MGAEKTSSNSTRVPPSPMSSPSSSFWSRWVSNFFTSALRVKALPSSASNAPSGDALDRRLGLLDLVLLGLGSSIGAGIFVVTGTVARDAGPGVTISFILAGLSCVPNALCYAELASRFPAVGGAYLYAYTAFNELTALLVFVQMMFDYHIAMASVARSIASYVNVILELFPFFKENIPRWIGHGGADFFGGILSINICAPILIALLTIILCRGVGESLALNSFMTAMKVIIVLFIITVGSFEVDVSNWSPFAPNGFRAILTGTTVVFFAYVGFDAVANSAEESRRPQRDLPIGILGSLLICIALYVGVCLVVTGMVPYMLLGEDAPLAEAFTSKGLKYVSVMISIGAVAGLTTTLLIGLYVKSRVYLGLGRDGLLPSILAEIHPMRRTPTYSQVWVGIVTGVLAALFNVHVLVHILSVGSLTGYSVVSACVVTLRWKDTSVSQVSAGWFSAWREGVACLIIIACCGFSAGLFWRINASSFFLLGSVIVAIIASIALCCRHVYADPPGFYCPGVPIVPAVCIFCNIFLFAQLHYEAWVRFIVLNIIAIGIYAFYGQYHSNSQISDESIFYHRAPAGEAR